MIKENFDNPIIILFGNKVDASEIEWIVKDKEIKEFLEKNNLEHFKVTSKNKTSLNEGFSFLANRIYDEIKQNELYNQYKKLKLKLTLV